MIFFGKSKDKLSKQLATAARKGQLAEVKKLVAAGAEIDLNTKADLALFGAAYYGHVECVQFLLESGANVNKRNNKNCTALTGAAEKGHIDIIKILLEAGADPTMHGLGRTARTWASIEGHKEISDILYKAEKAWETAQAGDIEPPPPSPPKPAAPVQTGNATDEVVFESMIGNRLLQEVFNFARLERISLVRKSADADVEAITRERFSELADDPALRKAFDEHRRRGGKTEEAQVFPFTFRKPKVGH